MKISHLIKDNFVIIGSPSLGKSLFHVKIAEELAKNSGCVHLNFEGDEKPDESPKESIKKKINEDFSITKVKHLNFYKDGKTQRRERRIQQRKNKNR